MNIDFNFINSNFKIAIASSGGMDSMVLCDLFLKKHISFSVIHCNFQLRGEESNLDHDFIKSYCNSNNLTLFDTKFDTLDEIKKNKSSIEIEARNLRYRFFEKIKIENNLDFILTAHHENDLAETVLMRIISGTGINGLQGIPKTRDFYYRPMLNISKNEIIQYAKQNMIDFRQDQSNFENTHIRNKIRNIILPEIEKINPSIITSLIQISILSSEVNELLLDSYQELHLSFEKNSFIDLRYYKSKKYLNLILYFIFKNYFINKSQINQFADSLFSNESKIFYFQDLTLETKNGIVYKVDKTLSDFVQYNCINDLFSSTLFSCSLANDSFEPHYIYFDLDKLIFPIKLRVRKTGDKIEKLGMKGKWKKISQIYQENKFSINQKNGLLIFEDADSDIIGILGVTSSVKTCIDHSSKKILKLVKL